MKVSALQSLQTFSASSRVMELSESVRFSMMLPLKKNASCDT